jgi:NAD+ synthase
MHAWLKIDPAQEVERICRFLRQSLVDFKRRGYIVGVSGGIDSSVTLALCCAAIGAERVGALVAQTFGARRFPENISPILESLDFYRRYDEAVRLAIPHYGAQWKSKIVLRSGTSKGSLSVFYVVARAPDGQTLEVRLPHEAYLQIVAATNFKQRCRAMLEYYYADRYNYAVAGTPNRLEYDQGFFVKLGDGAADVKPIAHLYKSQVYLLAEYLNVPAAIRSRPPTTDTYSLDQGQDEFYFSVPYEILDVCLFAKNKGLTPADAAPEVGLSTAQVERVYQDIETKRATTRFLHLGPQLVEKVAELHV